MWVATTESMQDSHARIPMKSSEKQKKRKQQWHSDVK